MTRANRGRVYWGKRNTQTYTLTKGKTYNIHKNIKHTKTQQHTHSQKEKSGKTQSWFGLVWFGLEKLHEGMLLCVSKRQLNWCVEPVDSLIVGRVWFLLQMCDFHTLLPDPPTSNDLFPDILYWAGIYSTSAHNTTLFNVRKCNLQIL